MNDEYVMDLFACQRRAEKEGYNSATFDLLCPAGIKSCQWMDAYFGLFKLEGLDGFLRVQDVAEEYPEARCVSFRIPEKEAA